MIRNLASRCLLLYLLLCFKYSPLNSLSHGAEAFEPELTLVNYISDGDDIEVDDGPGTSQRLGSDTDPQLPTQVLRFPESGTAHTTENTPPSLNDTSIDLELSKKDFNRYKFSKEKNVYTYIALDGFSFGSVSHFGFQIWKAGNSSEWSKKVVLSVVRNKKILGIYYGEKDLKFYTGINSDWMERPTLVPLDINTKTKTDEILYLKVGTKTIFRPRPGFLFHLVMKGKTDPCSCLSSDVIIWQCHQSSDSAYMVEIDEPKNKFDIFLMNGDIKHFHMQGGQWVQKSPLVSIDLSSKKSAEQYKYKLDGDRDVYFANQSYFFDKATDGGKIIWKCTDSKYAVRFIVKRDPDGYPDLKVLYPGEKEIVPKRRPKPKPKTKGSPQNVISTTPNGPSSKPATNTPDSTKRSPTDGTDDPRLESPTKCSKHPQPKGDTRGSRKGQTTPPGVDGDLSNGINLFDTKIVDSRFWTGCKGHGGPVSLSSMDRVMNHIQMWDPEVVLGKTTSNGWVRTTHSG